MKSNAYEKYVAENVRLLEEARGHPKGGFEPAGRPAIPPDAPKALFFAPHPDDECVVGGLALRLLRQGRFRVVDVAVTLGSLVERRAERLRELRGACGYLGFELALTAPLGLERINPKARDQDPAHWQRCVKVVADILAQNRPRVVMCPHEHDWNTTHIGTHFVVFDALKQMPADFECVVIETEFWGQMNDPNLLVELSPTDLADMIAATTFHLGEIARNPYHLKLPAWAMNNVLRGSELVGGQGGAGADFPFGAVYRLRRWRQGELVRTYSGGKIVPCGEDITRVL
jgi:LmbE family N-acetylglucosaminyl deacetylase